MSSTASITPQKITPALLANRVLRIDPKAIESAIKLGHRWRQSDRDRKRKPGTPDAVRRAGLELKIRRKRYLEALVAGRVEPTGGSDFGKFMSKGPWKADA